MATGDQKPSTFTPATSVAGTDLVPIIQAGQNKVAPASLLGGTVTVSSPDNSVVVSGSPGNTLALQIAAAFSGAFNILPGKYLYANLPSAAANVNLYAVSIEYGAVFSNGVIWQILFNATQGVLAISSNSPLTSAQQSVAYSQTLTATGGIGALTWSLVQKTGTNTWALSSAGVLTGTPGTIETDYLVVQVSDSTGAVAQKTLALPVVAALTPAATPTFSPVAGSYSTTQNVTISSTTPSNTIYYTTNGSTPTTGSTVYTTPVVVSTSQTLRAIATAAGFTQSAVGSSLYSIGINAVGTNTAPIGYYEPELPFLNILKSGGISSGAGPYNWATSTTAGSGNTNEEAALNLNADGYPLQIPQPGLTGTLVWCNCNVIGAVPGVTYPYAQANTSYTVQFSGAGAIAIRGDVTANGLTNGSTFTVVTPSATGLQVAITSSTLGNPITNLSIVETSLLASFNGGAIYHPNFLARIPRHSCLRFMKALQTNAQVTIVTFTSAPLAGATSATVLRFVNVGSGTATTWFAATSTQNLVFSDGTVKAVTFTKNATTCTWTGGLPNTVTAQGVTAIQGTGWASRPQLTNCFWGTSNTQGGLPPEAAIALCNLMGTDLWYNVPITYSDADIHSLGTLVNSTLTAGLNAYFELGNEVWNGAYSDGVWAQFGGVGLGFGSGFTASNNWYGMRCAQMATDLQTAFGGSFSRCFPVIGGQWANSGVLTQAITAPAWSGGPPSNFPIKIATVAGYFGFNPSLADANTITSQADGGLNYLFQCMTSNVMTGGTAPGTLTSIPPNGWIGLDTVGATISAGPGAGTYPGLIYYVNWLAANYPALKLAAYESGWGMDGSISTAWSNLLVAANRDARLGTAFSTYLNWWKTNVGGRDHPNLLFYDIERATSQFQWGTLESSQQVISPLSSAPPRYQAVQNFIGP